MSWSASSVQFSRSGGQRAAVGGTSRRRLSSTTWRSSWLQMLRAGDNEDNELARMGILCDVANAAAVVALAFAAVILLSR